MGLIERLKSGEEGLGLLAVAEIERLQAKLKEAIADIQEFEAHAHEHIKNNWDLDGCIKKHIYALEEPDQEGQVDEG